MRRTIITIALTALVTSALVTARVYHNLNTGVAWNWGGVEVLPQPALFICPGNWNFETSSLDVNPLAELFPALVTDC